MGKALVVVESPAKAKTINKYLGRDYKVVASMGHIRDLPKSKLGVDVDNDFAEEYVSIESRKKVIKELKDAAKDATDIYVATDPDREGEAIGWHITQELKGNKRKFHRLTFNEITKKAVQDALNHPRSIDVKMVAAQRARPVLDRLVGDDERTEAQSVAAVHHEQAAADGALSRQENDDAGAAAVRRGHRDSGADRRADHVYAHRLGARRRRRDCGRPPVRENDVRRR